MDIRSFFGGEKKRATASKADSAPSSAGNEQQDQEARKPDAKKTRVVVSDDEEDELFPSPNKQKKQVAANEQNVAIVPIKTEDRQLAVIEGERSKDVDETVEQEDEIEVTTTTTMTATEGDAAKSNKEPDVMKETKVTITEKLKGKSGAQKQSKIEFKTQTSKSGTTTSTTTSMSPPSAADSLVPIESIPYSELAQVFDRISDITGRLAIQEEMKKFFKKIVQVCPDDLTRAVYLSINAVAPAFEGAELGVGDSLLFRAIAEVTGRSKDSLQSQYKELGDLGSVALAAKSKQGTLFGFQPKKLTVQEVFTQFRNIAKISGNKSQDQKVGIIKKLLIASDGPEAKYIVRGLQGKLRIGLAEQTVLVGLAHAIATKHDEDELTLEDAVSILKQVYSECPSYDEIVPAMLQHPLSRLPEVCHIRVGVPVKPMLAKPTKGIGEVLNRFEGSPFTCEFKYDGERAQIHRLANGEIKVFSRNLEDNTSKYPDVIAAIKESLVDPNTAFIVDAEVVAYDRVKEQILPFQILSTRARKDVKTMDEIKVQVVVYLFDMLFLNGQSLLKSSLANRRDKLKETFRAIPHKVQFAIGKDLTTTEDILEFFNDSVKGNCEGLMIKTLEKDATYEPSKRSLNWLKLKKDYMDNLGDSVDLVPIGAYFGRGKRTGVYGGFLMAVYDPDNEEFQSVCKLGTGFSEEALEEHSTFMKAHIVPEKPRNYLTGLDCDVWFEPCVVWEIKAADLSLSPVHKAAIGLVKQDKGIGLRFPRFLRKRDDKKPEDATGPQQIEQMYREQAVISQNGGGDDDEDDW